MLQADGSEQEGENLFQQDVALPNFGHELRNALNIRFPNQWTGTGGPTLWLPCSPDMLITRFFLWGFINKHLVYGANAQSTSSVRQDRSVAAVTPGMLQQTWHETDLTPRCLQSYTQCAHCDLLPYVRKIFNESNTL